MIDEKQIDKCLRAGNTAAYENMMLPKNLAKGDYIKNYIALFEFLQLEITELKKDILNGAYGSMNNHKEIRSEAADVIAFASMIVELADSMIKDGTQ